MVTGDGGGARAGAAASGRLGRTRGVRARGTTTDGANLAVLTLAVADAELQRLNLLKKNDLDEQYVARRSITDLPGTIAKLTDRLSKLTDDQNTIGAHATDRTTIGGRSYSRDDIPAALGEQLKMLPAKVMQK